MAGHEAGHVDALPPAGRLRDMHGRIEERLTVAGLSETDRQRVLETNARSMLRRLHVLGDEAHFEILHSARSMLVLLDDCGVIDPETLRAAASVESEHPALRVPPANEIASDVPVPDLAGDRLLEDLVSASLPARLAALAERLDHARHLHLRPREDWDAFHAVTAAAHAPVAQRTHPRLAHRFAWWVAMFAERFLEPRH